MGVISRVPAERTCDGAQHETPRYIRLVDEFVRLVDESVRLSFSFPATQRTTSCGTNICPWMIPGRIGDVLPRLLEARRAGLRRADAMAATGCMWSAGLGATTAPALHVTLSRAYRTSRESEDAARGVLVVG